MNYGRRKKFDATGYCAILVTRFHVVAQSFFLFLWVYKQCQ